MFRSDRRVARLRKQLADEKAAHDATRRELRVCQVELDTMAAVVARDRARVEAESAAYAASKARSEANDGRTDDGIQ